MPSERIIMENEKIEELIDLGSLLRKMITCLRRF